MSALVGWAVEALIASTLLMALVLLLRAFVRRQFGAQIAYALWALPLLRLLLPPLPSAWRAIATPISRAGETITVLVIDPAGIAAAAPTTTPAAAFPSLGLVLAALWAAGAAVFLIWHVARHSRFRRRMLGSAAALDVVGAIRVIESDAAPGPVAFGVMRRYVAFPRDFADRYDADERALALAHEIGHHQRGDLAANWIALGVLALHWFNPVAWRAFGAFRADQEMANDARVLAGRSAIDRHSYACAIVKAAHGGVVSAACHLHTINDLKGRLRMLTTLRPSRRRFAAGGTIVAALVVAGLGLTASGTSAASAITTRVGDAVGVDLQTVPPAP
ncbi:MAG: M56 family metallopeptidase, partial [Pseudomonadota bacterium]|nr:M56 family metallopeptidase [Pseudomonadota bacterium]